ncbi:hypothetical protein CWATWH0402_310 [Crocosphaera watsonii WH 0402]|uniref:Uncharacterized protein n=1 Tax=Crocosphaera watsonii WH 0402 TaxID=1284629 RepID=T2JJY2_CROWT|nr:hypothetical protein [Crocosphaera watsonii]CCQ65416.1 hypothetical protein CWATWH0402_310 [Crocosphaera watsonii WH 0402]
MNTEKTESQFLLGDFLEQTLDKENLMLLFAWEVWELIRTIQNQSGKNPLNMLKN